MSSAELLRQIADHTSDPSFILGLSQLPNPDEVLRKAGLNHQVYDQVLGDGHVISKVIDRRSGMLRREWQVEAGGETAPSKRAAELCRTALSAMEDHEDYPLENSLGCLQEAALRGHRALEVVWEKTADGFLPAFLRDIPGRRLIHTGIEWRLLTLDNPSFGMAFPARKVLMATHMATTDNPYGEALLSRCYWPYLFKHSSMKWWVTMSEKYGLPWIVGKLGGVADEPARRDLLNKLVAMVVDAVSVVPKDAEVDFKNLEGAKPDVHDRLISVCNAEISKILVGQTLSTELDQKGGSRAAAETHSGLRAEIVEADGKLVARVMNRLFSWITEINLGPGVAAPKFTWIDEDEPPKAWAEVAERAIKAMPGKIPTRWAYDKFGVGEEYRQDTEMVAAAQKTPPDATATAFALDAEAFTAEQQALEGLAEKGVAEGTAALAANERKILDTVLRAGSYEEAMQGLLNLYPELDITALQDTLDRTILAAGMYGRATVQEESK
jgi:phage gp29-like protein